MAIFSKHYSDRQKSEIEYLLNRGKAINKKLDEMGDEYTEDFPALINSLTRVKYELREAIEAPAMLDYHIAKAKEHIEEAERIRERWSL